MKLLHRRILAMASLAALALPGAIHAQLKGPKFLKAASTVAKPVVPGQPFLLTVAVTIDSPYHIQAHPAKEGYIPTELGLGAVKGFKIDGDVQYPKPTQAVVSGDKLPVYEGKVDFKAEILPDKSVKPGKYTLPVTLKYQGCNETACYPPATLNLNVAVTVTANRSAAGVSKK